MNAIDFVKKHGIEKASDCFNLCASPNDKWFIYMGDLISDKDFDDLEGIIDAFELVMEHGSLERAKKYAESPYTAPEVKEFLAKQIETVEQCQ